MADEKPNLDGYSRETINFNWSITFGDKAAWYVDERLGGAETSCRWGPLPSKELAYALIQERKESVRHIISQHMPLPA